MAHKFVSCIGVCFLNGVLSRKCIARYDTQYYDTMKRVLKCAHDTLHVHTLSVSHSRNVPGKSSSLLGFSNVFVFGRSSRYVEHFAVVIRSCERSFLERETRRVVFRMDTARGITAQLHGRACRHPTRGSPQAGGTHRATMHKSCRSRTLASERWPISRNADGGPTVKWRFPSRCLKLTSPAWYVTEVPCRVAAAAHVLYVGSEVAP